MSLVSLLATTILITLANSTPMIYAAATDQRAKIPVDNDHYLLILLLNRRDFDSKTRPLNEPLNPNDRYSISPISSSESNDLLDMQDSINPLTSIKDKRVRSLSVLNSVDVLRERVLLDLARRKAMENQGLFNRADDLVSAVGKRSAGFAHRNNRIFRQKSILFGGKGGGEIDKVQQ